MYTCVCIYNPILPLKVIEGTVTDLEVNFSVVISAVQTAYVWVTTLNGYRATQDTLRL